MKERVQEALWVVSSMASKSLRVLVPLFCVACMASSVVKAEDVLAEVDAQLRSGKKLDTR